MSSRERLCVLLLFHLLIPGHQNATRRVHSSQVCPTSSTRRPISYSTGDFMIFLWSRKLVLVLNFLLCSCVFVLLFSIHQFNSTKHCFHAVLRSCRVIRTLPILTVWLLTRMFVPSWEWYSVFSETLSFWDCFHFNLHILHLLRFKRGVLHHKWIHESANDLSSILKPE